MYEWIEWNGMAIDITVRAKVCEPTSWWSITETKREPGKKKSRFLGLFFLTGLPPVLPLAHFLRSKSWSDWVHYILILITIVYTIPFGHYLHSLQHLKSFESVKFGISIKKKKKVVSESIFDTGNSLHPPNAQSCRYIHGGVPSLFPKPPWLRGLAEIPSLLPRNTVP